MPLLSEIRFGSYLVYSPSGKSLKSVTAKNFCYAVKQDSTLVVGSPGRAVRIIPFLVQHLHTNLERTPLRELFADRPVLVPAPRSSLVKPGSLYPTKLICQQMIERGLGSVTSDLLERVDAVPKAAFQKPADRPTVIQHYNSMGVRPELDAPSAILVVDDVVTSGGMLLACVSKLQDAYPNAAIAAFALIRTMSGAELEAVVDACVGQVRLRGDRGQRTP